MPIKKTNKPTPPPAPKQQPKTLAKVAPKPLSTDVRSLAEQDAGMGQEGIRREDLSIPRLSILQDLSPQVKKTEPGYIKGAETGMICDPLTETCWPGEEGIRVIPISYRRAHIEWQPNRGGFVKDHGSDPTILSQTKRNDKGANELPNKNTISVNAEYFVYVIDEETGGVSPYLVSMTSSQMKKARRWNTILNTLRVPKASGGDFNPAMFYSVFRLTTVPERNDQGSWFGWKVTREGNTLDLPRGEEIYTAARDFNQQIRAGLVQASAPQAEAHAGSTVRDDSAPM